MGLSANLFYENNESETLFSRISLTPEQLEEAKTKKDNLLALFKPELSSSLDVQVKHWLQGSYKNHTIIRPIQKGDEFDIDVGIYILCNAEEEGLSALEIKQLNRKILEWYISNRPEAKVGESKTSCERLIYPSFFHIDIPIYYYDDETKICKLALQSDEWVDSDPIALQNWFDKKVSGLTSKGLAQLRRIIKYVKAWTAIKGKDDGLRIPSIAITVLVAEKFVEMNDDDDAFTQTTINVMNYVISNETLNNPVNGGDLFGFKNDEYEKIKGRSAALKNLCEYIQKSDDSFEQYVLWSATFEHMFPPFVERIEYISNKTNLPAITVPPKIRVRHLDNKNNLISSKVTDEVIAFREDRLYFSIENKGDYSATAEIHWIVRNQDAEAKRINDLGHTSVLSIDDERNEGCSYSGTHYMECLLFQNNKIMGIGAVKVRISGFSRPLRNPPKKKYYKGR